MNVKRVLIPPKEKHEREYKQTSTRAVTPPTDLPPLRTPLCPTNKEQHKRENKQQNVMRAVVPPTNNMPRHAPSQISADVAFSHTSQTGKADIHLVISAAAAYEG
jgi:hypothetical protein